MYDNNMRALAHMARQKEIPLSGMFELTDRCNLHCGFCYVCDRDTKMKCSHEKTADEWLSMISQAVDMGMLRCSFTGGDPFMREDFEEIYCKAYDMGLRVSIFTNGILIREKQRAYLAKRIPDLISISLYGASEEAYRSVCGGDGNFHRTMESLDGLRAAGLAFELKVLAMRPLINDYEAMGDITVKYKCPGKFDPFMCPGRDDPERHLSDFRIPPSQIMDLYRSFRRSILPDIQTSAEERTVKTDGVFLCGAGKDSFIITHDGRMMGCPSLTCFDAFPFLDGLESAWYTLKDLIKHAEGCAECADCQDRGKCFICPANRLCETGTITKCSLYLREMVSTLANMESEASG